MAYKKVIIDGYILGIGTVEGQGNITEEEYKNLQNILHNKPSKEGYRYRLNADTLEWEEYIPPEPEEVTE